MPSYDEKPESYSSYKKRIFNRYQEKARLLNNGIDCCSLRPKDKELLKQKIKSSF